MATDEKYLDSLLKSMTENEQQSRNMEDVMKAMNMEVEEKDAFSLSQDDLADMLDIIEEKEGIQPVIEEIQDVGAAAVLGSVDLPVFQKEEVVPETVSSGNEMADDDFIRNLIAQQEALEAESLKEPLPETETFESDITDFFQQTEELNDAEKFALGDNVVSEDANIASDESSEEWKFDLEALLQASDEETENTDNGEDVDFASLLSGENKEWDEVNDVTSKENYENMDVTELIDNLDEAQNDLLEINDLLKKADSNEYVETDNEDMLALLGGMQEEAAEENFFWGNEEPESDQTDAGDLGQNASSKGKKKKSHGNADKKGLFGKKSKKSKDTELQSPVEETVFGENEEVSGEEKKEKKPGRLAQFFTYITQETEEEPIDENAEILSELEREDAQKAKDKKKEKKSKKSKKKKSGNEEKNKDKAAKKAAKAEKQQEKRQKKEEKRQEKLKNKPAQKPGKLLSKKGKIVLLAFCASLVAAIFSLNTFIPDYVDKTHAREAFFVGDYEEVYKLLYNKKLSAGDQLIFDRATTVLSLQRKLASYQNNKKLEREVEALDALLLGVEKYHELENVDEIGVRSEVDELYNQICGILLNNYGLSQENALEMLSYDEFEYTRAIYNLIEGKGFSETEEVTMQEEPQVPQDVLPEEEEIINLNDL